MLPFTATLVIPRLLALNYGIVWVTPSTPLETSAVVAGVVLFLCGASLAVASVLRFAFDGDGTLAPWDPPTQFVATGPYRYVRNPMITGVTLVLCAQTLILRSWVHAAWTGVFVFLNVTFIPLVEEPGLRRRFGAAYDEYCKHVGRLVPRLTPYVARRAHGTVIAVVPASGRSSRFGSDKRRALIDGVPMLKHVVDRLTEAGIATVMVVDNNPNPERGMFSTIQMGMDQALRAGASVILVQPADMPFVRADTVRLVVDECLRTGRAVCPRHSGKRGHPLAFPRDLARRLLGVDASTPLNEAFAAIGLVRHEMDVDDPGVLRDVDVPSDLNQPTH